MDFASDNSGGASRKILEALVAANGGSTPGYGEQAVQPRRQPQAR